MSFQSQSREFLQVLNNLENHDVYLNTGALTTLFAVHSAVGPGYWARYKHIQALVDEMQNYQFSRIVKALEKKQGIEELPLVESKRESKKNKNKLIRLSPYGLRLLNKVFVNPRTIQVQNGISHQIELSSGEIHNIDSKLAIVSGQQSHGRAAHVFQKVAQVASAGYPCLFIRSSQKPSESLKKIQQFSDLFGVQTTDFGKFIRSDELLPDQGLNYMLLNEDSLTHESFIELYKGLIDLYAKIIDRSQSPGLVAFDALPNDPTIAKSLNNLIDKASTKDWSVIVGSDASADELVKQGLKADLFQPVLKLQMKSTQEGTQDLNEGEVLWTVDNEEDSFGKLPFLIDYFNLFRAQAN